MRVCLIDVMNYTQAISSTENSKYIYLFNRLETTHLSGDFGLNQVIYMNMETFVMDKLILI